MRKTIDIMEEFEKELKIAIKKILIQRGIEKKSHLIKSVKVEYDDKENIFEIIANDYFGYVSAGRKRHAKKVPINDLISWIKQYHISSTKSVNSTAYAIQTAIYKHGIKGKKFVNPIMDYSADYIAENGADEIAKNAAKEIADAINK